MSRLMLTRYVPQVLSSCQRPASSWIALRSCSQNGGLRAKGSPAPRLAFEPCRRYCSSRDGEKDGDKQLEEEKDTELLPSSRVKHKSFKDEDAQVILDYEEEKYGVQTEDGLQHDEDEEDEDGVERERENRYMYQGKARPEFGGISLERGKTGVFDVEDLVQVLRIEKMRDIAVIKVPSDIRYTDYLILATALSYRHLDAVAQFVKKLYKLKKHEADPFLLIEGEKNCKDWKVMDMDRIVCHLFMEETREKYDIETLWCVGPEFDEKTQRPVHDPIVDIMEKHIKFIEELEPNESNLSYLQKKDTFFKQT